MHLVTFSDAAGRRIGILDRDAREVFDLAAADSGFPREMNDLVSCGSGMVQRARECLQVIGRDQRLPLDALQLHAPIPRPKRNIICVGKNYREHAREFQDSGFDVSSGGREIPETPIFFTKATGTVSAPGEPIPAYLDPTGSTDYEGELAIVIGRGGRAIPKVGALEHVFGYTILNDVTARTLQQRHRQWFLGKSLDGFCPMGPALVTADAIGDVTRLMLETRVNGERRQSASIADLIFDIPTLIEILSASMTLEPGDIIATGTCAGVGIGFDPPRFLRKGDRVAITVEPIGTLENPVA